MSHDGIVWAGGCGFTVGSEHYWTYDDEGGMVVLEGPYFGPVQPGEPVVTKVDRDAGIITIQSGRH